MNLKDVVTFIITDESVEHEGMSAIITAVKERQKLNNASAKVKSWITMDVGTAVVIGQNISPKKFRGCEATIVGFNKTRSRADLKITKSKSLEVTVGNTHRGFPVSVLQVCESPNGSSLTSKDADIMLEFLS